jgi:hypothetical protein
MKRRERATQRTTWKEGLSHGKRCFSHPEITPSFAVLSLPLWRKAVGRRWTVNAGDPAEIPQEVTQALNKALEGWTGSSVEPVGLSGKPGRCGQQLLPAVQMHAGHAGARYQLRVRVYLRGSGGRRQDPAHCEHRLFRFRAGGRITTGKTRDKAAGPCRLQSITRRWDARAGMENASAFIAARASRFALDLVREARHA